MARLHHNTDIFGKKGRFEVRLLYIEPSHGFVRLSGGVGDNGRDASVWSVGGTSLMF